MWIVNNIANLVLPFQLHRSYVLYRYNYVVLYSLLYADAEKKVIKSGNKETKWTCCVCDSVYTILYLRLVLKIGIRADIAYHRRISVSAFLATTTFWAWLWISLLSDAVFLHTKNTLLYVNWSIERGFSLKWVGRFTISFCIIYRDSISESVW